MMSTTSLIVYVQIPFDRDGMEKACYVSQKSNLFFFFSEGNLLTGRGCVLGNIQSDARGVEGKRAADREGYDWSFLQERNDWRGRGTTRNNKKLPNMPFPFINLHAPSTKYQFDFNCQLQCNQLVLLSTSLGATEHDTPHCALFGGT